MKKRSNSTKETESPLSDIKGNAISVPLAFYSDRNGEALESCFERDWL